MFFLFFLFCEKNKKCNPWFHAHRRLQRTALDALTVLMEAEGGCAQAVLAGCVEEILHTQGKTQMMGSITINISTSQWGPGQYCCMEGRTYLMVLRLHPLTEKNCENFLRVFPWELVNEHGRRRWSGLNRNPGNPVGCLTFFFQEC